MGFKSRDMSKSKRLQPLDIKCNHLGTTEYWCRGCAWIAADMLRRELEEKDSRITGILSRIDDALGAGDVDDPTVESILKSIRRDVERLKRWP